MRTRHTPLGRMALVVAAAALLLSACGGGKAATSKSSSSSAPAAHRAGGTVTFAETPGNKPDYIFPLESSAYYTGANSEDFSYLFWLPVYWFGQGTQPVINKSLSLAYLPTYSDHGRVATVRLKPYKWSDGKPVTAKDVLFWMQLLKAERANWGAYVPGGFPDNVVSTQVTGPRTIVFHLNNSYSSLWFTYNELSQLVAIPQHVWDRTSLHGPVGNYAATTKGAKAVYNFLNAQSKDLSSYTTNPLWKVVDGPFKLASFSSTGQATLVPNPAYSGKHAIISKLVELPYTSNASEFNSLLSGHGPNVGYLPPEDLSAASRLTSSGYDMAKQETWSISFIPLNFRNPTAGPIFDQLYVRQALQYLINQPDYIKRLMHGAGWPTYGPVPTEPPTRYISSVEKTNPFPYNPKKAVALLRGHGWAIHPGGTDVCVRPGRANGDCGPGVPAGARMSFKMLVAAGSASGDAVAQAMRSSWSSAGIDVTISEAPSNTVFSTATGCLGQAPSSSACSWQMADDAAGGISWFYSDDYLPTGGELFAKGGTSNEGQYSNPRINAEITATHRSSSLAVFYRYENDLARQVPVLWIPSTAGIVAWSKNLHGILPLSSVYSITPWMWYYTR